MANRAQAIFDSAMQRTSMKWGKAAKLAAGAAIVFAMREQERGDRTHYVAVSSSSFPLFISVDTIGLPGQFPCCLALWLWPCASSTWLVSCPISLPPVIGVKLLSARIFRGSYPPRSPYSAMTQPFCRLFMDLRHFIGLEKPLRIGHLPCSLFPILVLECQL